MPESNTTNVMLLVSNLFIIYTLYLVWGRCKRKWEARKQRQGRTASGFDTADGWPDSAVSGAYGNGKRRDSPAFGDSAAEKYQTGGAVRYRKAGWLLEFAVYAACMARLTDLIIQGIQMPGNGSNALFVLRILLAESILFLFPLWKIMRSEREYKSANVYPAQSETWGNSGDGIFSFAMFLLLLLVLQGWRDTNQVRAFFCQAAYLFLFLGLEYLEERQKYHEMSFLEETARTPQTAAASEGLQRQRRAEYLKNIEQQYQRTRELWHDLKNHINILEILAQEERFGELTDYLDSFRRDVERRMIPMKTGCAAVDALLGDKLYLAGKQGTEMSLQLCNLSRMQISAVDLCVILGNLLDNALEACGAVPEDRRISLHLKQEDEFYYLKVVNTAREPMKEGEQYLSGKPGRENKVGHGLGLRSVERIAHQYGGMLVTEYNDGEFTAVVRLEAAAG